MILETIKDWRFWASLLGAFLLIHISPITAGFVAGVGGTSFYFRFIRRR